ncbi:hypothetical protein [Nesterenkonia jeotgali]|uniref:Uncharacterized protein n=1 Tax=Nesterenkonia jeotgali TaxID=317018 RepID=A0A839FRW2_9MICC|nr:hypothetical protein [Nesterenkonia jeotgali]MBA8921351.1 hypothetical protein [Nesterenkonia jeotgali]
MMDEVEELAKGLAALADRNPVSFPLAVSNLAEERPDLVEIPVCLEPPPNAGPWQQRWHEDAKHLYRVVALVGDYGIQLRHLKHTLGSVAFQEAQKILRSSGAVVESKEPRLGMGDKRRNLIVLRTHGAADQHGRLGFDE